VLQGVALKAAGRVTERWWCFRWVFVRACGSVSICCPNVPAVCCSMLRCVAVCCSVLLTKGGGGVFDRCVHACGGG